MGRRYSPTGKVPSSAPLLALACPALLWAVYFALRPWAAYCIKRNLHLLAGLVLTVCWKPATLGMTGWTLTQLLLLFVPLKLPQTAGVRRARPGTSAPGPLRCPAPRTGLLSDLQRTLRWLCLLAPPVLRPDHLFQRQGRLRLFLRRRRPRTAGVPSWEDGARKRAGVPLNQIKQHRTEVSLPCGAVCHAFCLPRLALPVMASTVTRHTAVWPMQSWKSPCQ